MTSLKKIWSLVGRRGSALHHEQEDIRDVFFGYKRILDDNGRALEIINDISEKTSGDYLFDIAYIREAYSDLVGAMRISLNDFNQLTDDKYPQLGQVFNRIDALIRDLIDPRAKKAQSLVIFLEDVTIEAAREVGGKSFHLSQLKNTLGLRVPEGFAITAFAYEQFIKHNRLDKIIAALENGEPEPEAVADLRQRILSAGFPQTLKKEVERALDVLRERCGDICTLAVRSSAEEEDDIFSFAGQFETMLNVPPDVDAVLDAYRKVVASLFSEKAMAYQLSLNYRPATMSMAVGVMTMVDALSSGVAYTIHPLGRDQHALLINSAWGLGTTVVDDLTDADTFVVSKSPPFELEESQIGSKKIMAAMTPGEGIEQLETPPEKQREPSLTEEALATLSRQAIEIENFYKSPQDIEWAVDHAGNVVILQSRPLRVGEPGVEQVSETASAAAAGEHPIIMSDQGTVVHPGVVGGMVFMADDFKSRLTDFPRGAILVARNDSPQFVRVMPYAAAIITDSGNATSHMASISREFRVPTVVNTGNATALLEPGKVITLKADDEGGMALYQGMARDIIDRRHDSFIRLEELFEYRRQKYILKFIAPLNLVNPFTDDFVPERCRTFHDILRFIHEKSMWQLIDTSRNADRRSSLKRLQTSLLEDIHVIDIGGGLEPGSGKEIDLEQVNSLPLRAVIEGMEHPGAWRKDVVPLGLSDLLTASMRTGEVLESVDINLAVISHRYMNLAVRFGYHFTVVDSFVSEDSAKNHVYFRFMGGAAAMQKRVRRVHMLEIILQHLGFITDTKGDLITGVVSNISRDEALRIIDQSGRLMAYTRQMDAPLVSDAVAEIYAQRFIEGDYSVWES